MTRNPDTLRRASQTPPDPSVAAADGWQSIISRILAAMMIATIVILAQKLLIQIISINYHRTQFHGKIRDSKRNIYLLGLLYDASRSLFPAYCLEFEEEDYLINDSLTLSVTDKKGASQQTGTSTPMRFIHDVGRFGDKITSGQTSQQPPYPTSANIHSFRKCRARIDGQAGVQS